MLCFVPSSRRYVRCPPLPVNVFFCAVAPLPINVFSVWCPHPKCNSVPLPQLALSLILIKVENLAFSRMQVEARDFFVCYLPKFNFQSILTFITKCGTASWACFSSFAKYLKHSVPLCLIWQGISIRMVLPKAPMTRLLLLFCKNLSKVEGDKKTHKQMKGQVGFTVKNKTNKIKMLAGEACIKWKTKWLWPLYKWKKLFWL